MFEAAVQFIKSSQFQKAEEVLALNREKLQSIREKLARNRLTTPLFDTPLYTKHLEAAYEAMYHRYQAGLRPDHIRVSRADGNQARSAGQIGALPNSA
jgi:hypothetical protein